MGKHIRTKYPGIFIYKGREGELYGVDFYANGKRHREIVGPRLTDAREELEKRRGAGRSGVYVSQTTKRARTFEDLAMEYEKTCGQGKYFQDTRRHYVEILKDHFRGKKIYEIDTKAIEQFENIRKDTKTKHKRERSGIAVNRELETLRVLLNKAVLWGWLEKNPFRKFVEQSQSIFFDEGEARDRVLTEDEVKSLFAVLEGKPPNRENAPYIYLRNIIAAALLTGLRRIDILCLKWEDVDWKTNTLRYWEEKKKKWRTKQLITPTIELLNSMKPKEEKTEEENPTGFIFTDPNGKPLKDVKRSFKTVLKKAGIKNFRFHDLRRSSATFLLKMGCPLPVIQKHLEHTSLEMTQRYLHLQDETERAELEKLGGLFAGKSFTGQKMGRSDDFEEMPVAATA
jgi:integrase